MQSIRVALFILLNLQFSSIISSYYEPNRYCLDKKCEPGIKNDLELFFNPLISYQTYSRLDIEPFKLCFINDKISPDQSLSEILAGNYLYASNFTIPFGADEKCVAVCHQKFDDSQLKNYLNASQKFYLLSIYADNIPALNPKNITSGWHLPGIPISFQYAVDKDNNAEFSITNIVNMFEIKVHYIQDKNIAQVVNITITENSLTKCGHVYSPSIGSTKEFTFYYSVQFLKVKNEDMSYRYSYLYDVNKIISYSKLIHISPLIILISTCFYAYRMYSKQESHDDHFGWKVLLNDIFRPPKHLLLLSASVGTGIQILAIILSCLVLTVLGIISSVSGASIIRIALLSYVGFGVLAGYVSASIYKFFDGIRWKSCSIASAMLHHSIFLGLCIFYNCIEKSLNHHSYPHKTVFGLVCIWFFLQVPANIFGSYVGFSRSLISYTFQVNPLPRAIPFQSVQNSFYVSMVVGSLTTYSFVRVFLRILLLYPLQMWKSSSIVFFFITSTEFLLFTALITFVLSFKHLSAEDYRWHWRSFFVTASGSLVFLLDVSISLFDEKIFTDSGSTLYIINALMHSYLLALVAGSIGFLSGLALVLKLYISMKFE